MISASRKLRHYFQAHVINVMTDHPLKKAMNKLEAAGRLIQWAVELSEFDIRYQPRHAIKAQALVDFIAEFTPGYDDIERMEDNKRWVIHMDGSFTQHVGGIGVVLQSPKEISRSTSSVCNTNRLITKLNMKPSLKGWNWLSLWKQRQYSSEWVPVNLNGASNPET